jgi:NADPH:quinone reductase-like Zn-dependent oxidoreductase
MRAWIATRYGAPDVLQLRDVPRPVPVGNQLLIRIQATTVSAGDWRIRSLEVPAGFRLLTRGLFGFRRPRQPILGTEMSGVVEAMGPDVGTFQVGDQVIAFSDARMGCHAEFNTIAEDAAVVRRPAGIDPTQAAAIAFGGTTALQFLRWARLQPGETVLVNGASGATGSAAVQLARHLGAAVTGICSSANSELVKSLGAVQVIDYTRHSLTDHEGRYDVVIDTVGNLPYRRARGLLNDKGRLLLISSTLPEMLLAPWVNVTTRHRVIAGVALGRAADLQFLVGLVESGEFQPVIDSVYEFEQMIEAHRRVDGRHKRGTVVVRVTS